MTPAARRRALEVIARRPTYRGAGEWTAGDLFDFAGPFDMVTSRHVYPLLRDGLVVLHGPTRRERRAGRRHKVAKRGCHAALTYEGYIELAAARSHGTPVTCPECAAPLVIANPTLTPSPQLACERCGGMFALSTVFAAVSKKAQGSVKPGERPGGESAGSGNDRDAASPSVAEQILDALRSFFPGGGF